MAALEHSSWQIVDLAGSPVRRNATGWIGSMAVLLSVIRAHKSALGQERQFAPSANRPFERLT